MLLLLLCTLLQEPWQIDGLREGERFRTLSSSMEVHMSPIASRAADASFGFWSQK